MVKLLRSPRPSAQTASSTGLLHASRETAGLPAGATKFPREIVLAARRILSHCRRMNFPPFWARGASGDFFCWRWSFNSVAEAQSLADQAARQLADRFSAAAIAAKARRLLSQPPVSRTGAARNQKRRGRNRRRRHAQFLRLPRAEHRPRDVRGRGFAGAEAGGDCSNGFSANPMPRRW